MDNKYFDSDNPKVLGKAIKRLVNSDRSSEFKKRMREGVSYYEHEHDILNYKLYYIDDEENVQEEKNRSNIKIVHSFFTELVDQKTQYLLSNPVEVLTDETQLQNYLLDYIDEDFQVLLQELVEGSSKKGHEFVYFYYDGEDKIRFQLADSLKVIVIYDELNQIKYIIRYYDTDITRDGKNATVTKAELWSDNETWFFMTDKNGEFVEDPSQDINPRPHIVKEKDGKQYGKGLERIPFIKLTNNKTEKTDLEPIKDLIDDYDLMSCALSNNLVDFDHPIYAVKGYPGDNLDKLVLNLKTKKTIGVDGDNGGVDVKTIDIPVEARKTKLQLDKEAIYKFGMGFDSTAIGDGNITNVVIKSRYSLLDLKCNKAEVRLRQVIKQMLELIIDNINQLHGKAYDPNSLEIVITRDTMVNKKDVIDQEKVKEETKQVAINTLLDVSARLDDETVLKSICDTLEIDFEEVQKKLNEQAVSEYQEPTQQLNDETELIENE